MQRQQLAGLVRTFVETAIANDDTKYGRQLASMFEKYSMHLRLYFGGPPLWATSQKLRLQRKHPHPKEQVLNGNQESE